MLSNFKLLTRATWTRRLALGVLLTGTVGVCVGLTVAAEASGNGSTTDVTFVHLSTPYKLFTNRSFTANSTYSVVVIGGSTTVPSNATTVQLSVEAGGANAGTMNFYPAGNPSGASGQSLTWTAGNKVTTTIVENVGLKDEVTFALSGAATNATATIAGYSTQVTAGDVSGLDGAAGQVLTDNGSGGASWQSPFVTSGEIGGSGGGAGQVLTNTGSGSAWENIIVGTANISGAGGNAGQVLTDNGSGGTQWSDAGGAAREVIAACCSPLTLGTDGTTVLTMSLPTGSYEVSFATEIRNNGTTADRVFCEVASPTNTIPVPADGGDTVLPGEGTMMSISGLVSTGGGTFTAWCSDENGQHSTVVAGNDTTKLVATQVSSETGGATG